MLEGVVKFITLLLVLALCCGSPASSSEAALSPSHQISPESSSTSAKQIVIVSGARESASVSAMNQQKIDPSLLIELERLKADGQLAQELIVIIRTEHTLNAEQRAEIEKSGGKINSEAGDILTAVIPGGNIPTIADLKFVLYIEKSKKQKLR